MNVNDCRVAISNKDEIYAGVVMESKTGRGQVVVYFNYKANEGRVEVGIAGKNRDGKTWRTTLKDIQRNGQRKVAKPKGYYRKQKSKE